MRQVHAQAAQTHSLEKAANRSTVEIGQEVLDDKGEIIERKAGGLALRRTGHGGSSI